MSIIPDASIHTGSHREYIMAFPWCLLLGSPALALTPAPSRHASHAGTPSIRDYSHLPAEAIFLTGISSRRHQLMPAAARGKVGPS